MHRTPAVRVTLAALSLGAAVVHFAMTPQHTRESIALGIAFVVAAWAQVAVAGWLLFRPDGTSSSGARPSRSRSNRRVPLLAGLMAATKASIPKWSDPEAAEAAGFRSIQGPDATFVHFVHFGWMYDGVVLDPEHPESLVYRSTNGSAGGYVLESAMYILPGVGYPVPDVGGSLWPWHNHEDLCFRPDGMIVGTTAAGECPAGSSNFKTPDMLHVWIVDHADGPFGGLEA